MKTLSQHISEKLIICPSQVDEKLIINKNYNYNSLDDIYKFEWKLDRHGGLYCKDTDNLASNAFYEYFVNSSTKKLSFAQQCKYANDGDYLCALKECSNGTYIMYLFHLNDTHDNTNFLYSKFVFIPINNGIRIEYDDNALKKEVYSLSRKSSFSSEGLTPEYYLVSEDTWNDISELYNELIKK